MKEQQIARRRSDNWLNSSFCAGELFFNQANSGEVTHILYLGHERICPLCCLDLNMCIPTGNSVRVGFRSAPVKAGNSRESSQGPFEDFVFLDCRRMHWAPYVVHILKAFMIHEQIMTVNKIKYPSRIIVDPATAQARTTR
jgi:hypothetical protein